MWLWHSLPDPFRALTGAFFARFFENEITSGVDDLKGTFFWLLAALALPGMFIPWMMAFDWQLVVLLKGPMGLREASQAEKVFYLGFAMIASGVLTVMAWNTLLPDRRDTLILGTLPVAAPTIIAAKLAALAGYIMLIALAMHAIGALFFGSILATNTGSVFALRGMAAHLLASAAASAGIALMVAAAQGLTLALAGPRWFRRLSTILQAGLVALIATGLALLPIISSSVVHSVRGFGPQLRPWVLSTPPAWFLGLYEWLLGTSDPVLIDLAQRAGLSLLAAIAVIVTAYPIAYRRLMVSAIELGPAPARHFLSRMSRWVLVGAAGRNSEARAAADFYMATLGRVERHRFVLAMALGLGSAYVLAGWQALDPPTVPAAGWLSLPLAAMIFLMAGLRIVASLPGDVRAGWLFEVRETSRAAARRALERTIFLVAVLLPSLAAAPVYWWLWNSDVALLHFAVSLGLGAVVLELLLWQVDGMPCGQRWQLRRANLGRRWPLYFAAFLVITVAIPRIEILLLSNVYAAAIFVSVLLALAGVVRFASARRVIVPSYDDVDPVAGVLRLN